MLRRGEVVAQWSSRHVITQEDAGSNPAGFATWARVGGDGTVVGGPTSALDRWRLIRRYAVPEWMIAECAEARERGDWQAACEAGRVTVTFDEAGPVADLLAGFAPDLLRWHLPRAMDGTAALRPGMRYVLTPDGPVTADTVVLGVRTPNWETSAQRLTLHAVPSATLPRGWSSRSAAHVGRPPRR